MNKTEKQELESVAGVGLDYYKNYVSRVLGRAKTDENFLRHNKEAVYWAMEAAGLVSIAEFGNEEAKQDARRLLETAFYTGKGEHGETKIRKNNAIMKLIQKAKSREKPKPVRGELFAQEEPGLIEFKSAMGIFG
jgi:hypothetical protein